MDEIIIDEKKYVSSKRAAKITGYAKDYIGQLCREGRVTARLVGRSWYVLESAIEDHRFGPNTGHSGEEKEVASPKEEMTSTWESPKYEADSSEYLPSINRLRSYTPSPTTEREEVLDIEGKDDSEVHLEPKIDSGTMVEPVNVENHPQAQEPIQDEIQASDEENIPIHTVYELPPENLLPKRDEKSSGAQQERLEEFVEPRRGSHGLRDALIFFLGLITFCVFIYTVFAIGLLDKQLISSEVDARIFGIQSLNK